jgi:hypothetical protein
VLINPTLAWLSSRIEAAAVSTGYVSVTCVAEFTCVLAAQPVVVVVVVVVAAGLGYSFWLL